MFSRGRLFINRISNFSGGLKEYREQSGITLEAFSHRVAFPNQALNLWELGDRFFKIDVVAVLAEKLNVCPLWLIGYNVAEFLSQPSKTIHFLSESTPLNKVRALDIHGQFTVPNVPKHKYQTNAREGASPFLPQQA